ncbi:MAG: hypothetical protein U1A25_03280 [Candidatus Sungbacteria bacterium]|nr:hypothetical protein [bacterium]MDZ4260666.1 hypothetical protein [Candidatus Sungbacteria bacterium]
MQKRKKILCVADAPGPAEFLAPVIPLLCAHHDTSVVAVGTAMDILGQYQPRRCNDEGQASEIYADINPDYVVSAISSLTHGPYVNNRLIAAAYENGVPVICLQDYWANHRVPHNQGIIPMLAEVCVSDDFAASLWKEDGFTGYIDVTGNPAFDRFTAMDVAAERSRLRNLFGLTPRDRVIVFAGQGTPKHIESDKKTFAYVTDAIRAVKSDIPIKLIMRAHPRAVETVYYTELAAGIEIIDTSFARLSDDILPAADVVVSMFSTNLVHACYLRIPAISVLLPEQGRAVLKAVGLDDFPPNILGASMGIYEEDPAVLRAALETIFSDQSVVARMQAAQEKNFPLDGGAALRVATAIQEFMTR